MIAVMHIVFSCLEREWVEWGGGRPAGDGARPPQDQEEEPRRQEAQGKQG